MREHTTPTRTGDVNPTIVRVPQVMAMTSLSRTTIWRMVNDPDSDFPSPIRLTGKTIGFFLAEIEAWITSRPRV